MADPEKKHRAKGGKTPAVRPVFLIAGGIALLAFGAILGISLDLATRNPSSPPRPSAYEQVPRPQPREFRPPQFLNVPDPPADEDNFLAPQRQPQRAWAPSEDTNAYGSNSPLIANAVPSDAPANRPVVAIVIDDMGLDRTRSMKMMELEGPLTVSLMTYANGLPDLSRHARQQGHEVMGHLPMEPVSASENPGPGALLTDMDEATIRRHLAAYLDPWQGYVGINNHMGSKFTADAARMRIVMDVLKDRGLMWLDSKTSVESAGANAAAAANVPFVERDVFLDNVDSVPAVLEQLGKLEETAKSKGYAIGIGHPHDSTITALQQWLPALRSKGITLVPVTEVLKRRLQKQGNGTG